MQAGKCSRADNAVLMELTVLDVTPFHLCHYIKEPSGRRRASDHLRDHVRVSSLVKLSVRLHARS